VNRRALALEELFEFGRRKINAKRQQLADGVETFDASTVAVLIRRGKRSTPRKFFSGRRRAGAQRNEASPQPQPRSTCSGASRSKIFAGLSRSTSDSSSMSGEPRKLSGR